MPATRLLGRGTETRLLDDLLTGAERRGASLVVGGEPGIGKSALLQEAVLGARARHMRVLSTTGVESEAQLPYAGLHALLRPLLDRVDELAAPQGAALLAAFGVREAEAPDLFLIALAALDLLSDAAATRPLLVVVEDAHWLDRSSAEALAFVARRIDADPIVLLAASRDEGELPFRRGGVRELRLGPLDDDSAAALLDAQGAGLAATLRERVLAEAAGNPLALVELPIAWASQDPADAAATPAWLPLTTRLEQAFAARVSELPEATRTALVVAAVDEDGLLGEVLGAAELVLGNGRAGVALLEPARAAGLLDVDVETVRFRHPLVRSAILQAAGVAQRHAAHAALADVLVGQGDRQVWHRAASCVGPDEDVAAALEQAATRASRRGAAAAALAALQRAAQLSGDRASEGRRLLAAAQLAQELGRPEVMAELIEAAQPLPLGRSDRALLSWLREELDDTAWSGSDRIRAFVEIAGELHAAGEPERALRCILAVALRMWWSNPDQETRDLVVDAAERIGVPNDHPGLLAVLAYADPLRRGAQVIERIAALTPDAGRAPGDLFLIGAAASSVWAYDAALAFLGEAVDGLRAQGRLGLLAQALVCEAWAALHLAREQRAAAAADEGLRLARESGQPRWAMAAQLAHATLAAERGDTATAEALTAEAEAMLTAAGANPMLALVQFARGRGAVAHQRYEDGFDQLRRIVDPADVSFQPFVGAWALSDLVEAAVHLGRHDAARAYLGELESLVAATPGPLLRAELGYARPLVAADGDAEDLFDRALRSDLVNWPCYRGRLLLAYGRWLRRRRRVAESRAPLRAARETFDALAFHELSLSARNELRASGETSRRRAPDARDELTPQELQIAEMAAGGMTNREIGRRLYLSHRTVGSHLYRIFPKLGITSRVELRDALGARAAPVG